MTDQQPPAAPPTRGGVGISCSGGGIRAASFALGCLQVLDEHGVLRGEQHADYISAVSGGSYAVGAAAIIEYGLEHPAAPETKHTGRQPRATAPSATPPPSQPDPLGPYSPRSPELYHLRKHLGYLRHGPGGLTAEVWRALMGIVMNLVLFVSAAAFAGSLAGWIYGRLFRELRGTCATPSSPTCVTSVSPARGVVAVAIGLGALAAVVGLLWVLRRRLPAADSAWQRAALWTALLAALWALLALAMPQVLAWLVRSGTPKRTHTAPALSSGIRHSWLPLGGLGGLVVALRAAISELKSITDEKSTSGVAGTLRKFRVPLTNLVCAVAVPVLFGGLLVLFMYDGALHSVFVGGTSSVYLFTALAPALVLLFIMFFGDLNSWSLHTIYKARLGEAFDLERYTEVAPDRSTPRLRVQARKAPLPLSNLELRHFPEVLICATSNLTSYGEVPSGSGGAPFLFSQRKIGGPVVHICDTSAYEKEGLGRRLLTVMDAVSISGAAVSPEMGRMTRAPMRFLLALANVRLGVWLPKPRAVFPRAKAAAPRDTPKPPSGNSKWIPPPGVSHLLSEALGHNPPGSRYVYVTDGGHYDNLGLVELLRDNRQCEWIWCVDASGDDIDTFTTLGEALAIAEAEFGVSVEIAPEVDMVLDGPRFVKQPYCIGKIRYRPEPDGTVREGTLVVVKAGVPKNAPWSVLAYHAANAAFPCDSTINQLYTADKFDAYLALGHFAMGEAYAATQADYEHARDR